MNRYLNQESNNVAGVASTGISRSQSMTQGAGQAAMIALQRHNQQQNLLTPRQGAGVKQPVRRANSLTAASNRSNSMRSYTYHPKPSYTVGQPLGSTNQGGARRFNSLNSKSSVGSYHRPGARTNSLTSQNSFVRSRSPPVLYEQDEGEEEGDVTVTTKTTKVVDSQGRVLSVTVETIKTFADGSTVTNTTTKNISRNNSRANSLNSQSMASKGNTSGKHNSMLSNNAGGSYNLSKIDEDLQDFDYNYELDHDTLTQRGYGHPHVENAMYDLIHDENFHGQGLRLNHGSTYHGDDFGSPELHSYGGGGNESIHSTGLKSITSESSKPLKSILKKKNNINDKGPDDEEGFADAVDELQSNQLDIKQDDTQHPYKSLTSPQFNEPPKFKVPQSPNMQAPQQPNRISTNTGNKRTHSLMSSPISRHDDVLSDKSEASNSIKFLEKHETIPIFYNDNKPKELEHAKSSDKDFYSIAMQVAMERVYGNKENQQSPKLEGKRAMSLNSHTSPILEPKKEKRTQELNEQGVNDDYVYQNHHKDFVGLSLRDNVEPKQTSRKERAKEEKKQQKSEMKEQKQKMKEKEKGEAENLKTSSKEQKKSQKAQKHGRFASLFSRRKSTSNDNSILTNDGELNKYGADNNSQPTASNNNPIHESAKAVGSESEYQKINQKDFGQEDTSRAGGKTTNERAAGFTVLNPETERDNGLNTETQPITNNSTSIPLRDPDYRRNLDPNQSHDNQGLNNKKPEYDASVGYISNRDNSFNNPPPRPVFSNEGSGSYSMRFSRTDSATSDTKNLEDLSSRRGETGLNVNSEPQVRNAEDSNAGQQRFQDMPGSMSGVDSSILRAIVQNDSEVDPSFNHDEPDLVQKTTLDPSANLINDRTSVYSNDAEEKRKGKVLDPITVPVLNEIKSETTSIESQSNKYKDLGTELESNNDNVEDELLGSEDAHGYPEPGREVRDQDIEEEKGNSSQTLQETFNNEETPKPDFVPQVSTNDDLIDEAVLVNEDDVKGYDNFNTLSDEPITSSVAQNQISQEPIVSNFEDQNSVNPAVDGINNQTLNSKYIDSEELGRDSEYGKSFTGKIDSPSQAGETFLNNKEHVDFSPASVNGSLEHNNFNKTGNLGNIEAASNQPQNLQPTVPIRDGFTTNEATNKGPGKAADATEVANRDQLQSTYLPKSSFEHMQREESGSPVVVHDDRDINESKPSKKGNKFKQKLFKYFVNSYNN